MSTNNNYKKWRPGSNAAFGRNIWHPGSYAAFGRKCRPGSDAAFGRKNGVQGLMRLSAAKCQRKKIDHVVNFFSLTAEGRIRPWTSFLRPKATLDPGCHLRPKAA